MHSVSNLKPLIMRQSIKVIIIALELAYDLKLEQIKVFSNSQLVVGQSEGTLKENMKK